VDQPFQPYTKRVPERYERRFFFATKQAQDWYDPIEDTITNELLWLQKNVDFGKGRKYLDAGCHHGYYIVALADGCETLAVDIHMPNLCVCEVNCRLNDIPIYLWNGGIAHETGKGFYDGKALGGLRTEGLPILVATLQDVYAEANVVKMDIEGAEYYAVPASIDNMPKVDTWIVELHPMIQSEQVKTDPNDVIALFQERGYLCHWFDRAYRNSTLEEINGKIDLGRESTFVFRKPGGVRC
jgi:hypothetical protein